MKSSSVSFDVMVIRENGVFTLFAMGNRTKSKSVRQGQNASRTNELETSASAFFKGNDH